ncbi:type I-C CRISPR-associated protein Cas8c/Csd1 [Enterococcus sp. LJL98]
MSFFSALKDAYDVSLKEGLVDRHDGNNTILLPLYHTSLKSSGEDIFQVELTKEGEITQVGFVPKDEVVLFPVTSDSVARSGKNPPSHPLVDKLSYLMNEEPALHQLFLDTFHPWYHWQEESQVKEYLKVIKQFLSNSDFIDDVLDKIYQGKDYRRKGFIVEYPADAKGTIKKLDLSKTFMTFSVANFDGYKSVSVTNYIDLHQNYIDYVEENSTEKIQCNISGKMEQLTTKHRGLLGNAKLISVSNHSETYKGRFKEGSDIIQIGYQSSEKIHLMLKYLLENANSRKWLSGQQYLVNWFSSDIANEQEKDIFAFQTFLVEEPEETNKKAVTTENKEIGDSFVTGSKKLEDHDGYYVAIIDKASNGRLSLKFFRELEVSQLRKNLKKWQKRYSWERYNSKTEKKEIMIPSFSQLLLAAYGVEREGKLQLDNDNFKKDQYQKLVVSLIDGQPLPVNLSTALNQNIRKRLNYSKTWNQIQFVALAVLSDLKPREELSPMLDKNNQNRSYLFGRLLAIFERMEQGTYSRGEENDRVTNAQKFWTTYTNKPATTMQVLIDRNQPYVKKMKQANYGLFRKLEKEQQEIIGQLNEHYLSSKELNKPLDYHFIFGYYAETQFLFTKNESEEMTDANE